MDGEKTKRQSEVDLNIPIGDMMRCAMYNNSYKDRNQALTLFNALPTEIKANMLRADYSKAEKNCPHKIQIGRVLKKAYEDLT